VENTQMPKAGGGLRWGNLLQSSTYNNALQLTPNITYFPFHRRGIKSTTDIIYSSVFS